MDPVKTVFDTLSRAEVDKTATLEIECRIKLPTGGVKQNVAVAKHLIKSFRSQKSSAVIEQSINFIKTSGTVKKLVFSNGVQNKKLATHYTKEKIINKMIVLDNPPYHIHAGFEKTIEPFSVSECSHIRIKLRYSIMLGDWRLDITLVKDLNDVFDMALIKKNKSLMLYPIKVNEFVDDAPWNIANNVEFELEFIGRKLSVDSLAKAMNKVKDVMSGVGDVNGLNDVNAKNTSDDASKAMYQKLLGEMAKIIKPRIAHLFATKFGIKQLSNQVNELNRNNFLSDVADDITNYYITDKIDGKRTILYANKGILWSVSDVAKKLGDAPAGTYIMDTEEYEGVYWVFDVMMWKTNISTKHWHDRMEYLDKAVKLFGKYKLKAKPFIRLGKTWQKQVKTALKKKKPYETDGLILTPYNGTYNDMINYKWKPMDKLSVDFLIKKCPKKLLGIKPYLTNGKKLYLLFCGVSKRVFYKLKMKLIRGYDEMFPSMKPLPQYFPIQFTPSNNEYAYLFWSDKDLDGKIGEFTIANWKSRHTEYKWKLIRIREDRNVELARGNYFGNNYKIAEAIWMNFQNPLILDKVKSSGYFKKHDSKLHVASRAFNSFVKSQIFAKHKGVKHVLDLASGKGQDLFRYGGITDEVVFFEIDRDGLSELVRRKHDFSNSRTPHNMGIKLQQIDLNNKWKENVKYLERSTLSLPNDGFDLIVCNLAIHYLIANLNAVVNICNFVSAYLRPGGTFIFTANDGHDVFNLLGDKKEWKVSVGDEVKYHIVKKYKGSKLPPAGAKIDVMLPFSKDEFYTEYLLNIDTMKKEFGKLGMELMVDKSFGTYYDTYKPFGDKKLNADDLKYVSLYHHYEFKKTKGMTGGRRKKNKEPHEWFNAMKYKYATKYRNILKQDLKTKFSAIEKFDDVPYELPYQGKSGLMKPSIHIGQRKLFLSEVQFLVDNPAEYCVYAGAAPGNKTHYLSQLFPDTKFILIDPNKFDLKLENMKSHRDVKHDDIIHMYSGYPTKSWEYGCKKINKMSEKEKDKALKFIIDSDHKIFIIENYMDSDYAKWLSPLDHVFISDIRSNVGQNRYPTNLDIYWNSSMMFNWISELKPSMSMLKFRQIYADEGIEIKSMPEFDLSKKFGIDFIADMKKGVYRMPKSVLYLQSFAGRSSSELRMWIDKKDLKNIVIYDCEKIDDVMFYHNTINRGLCFHENDNASRELGFCHCNDCAIENAIWERYTAKYGDGNVHDYVAYLGKITGRPLKYHHTGNIWSDKMTRDTFESLKRAYDKESDKSQHKLNRKVEIHRGDFGKDGDNGW